MPATIQTRATISTALNVPFSSVAVLGWDKGIPVLAVPAGAVGKAIGMGLRAVACSVTNGEVHT